MVQFSHPCMSTGKVTALTLWIFVGKVMSLLFNTLSRFVIAFLPRSKHLLISWLQSPSAVILQLKKIKPALFPLFPHLFTWNDGTGCHDLSFLNVESQASFFTLLFHPHLETLFSSSSLSVIRVESSAYIRLSIILLAILISACESSSLAFCMVYSAQKLNKQGDNINMQPWPTPFPIWNQSVVPCPVLTFASWPTYRFFRRQVRWSGIPISDEFSTVCVIHSQKL